MKGSRLVGRVKDVRFLSPDVALIHAVGSTVMRGKAEPSPERDSIQTLVATRQDGEWHLAAFQNTRVRRSILPDAPKPEYTGIIGNGGYTHLSSVPPTDGVMYMTFCLKGFFGYQVLDSGEIYWFENFHQSTESGQSELDAIPNDRWRQKLLDLHRPDHEPIADIIHSTQGEIVRSPVHEMPILPTWYKGRVCLVGDSAHATGPHTGQGASMAMEDAIVLAKCLRDIDDVEEAFAAYQRIRKERVEFVVRETRRTGDRKAPPGLLGRWIRDLVLSIFLKQGFKTFNPVYAHHIDWDERVA